jgi:hypothetical protein
MGETNITGTDRLEGICQRIIDEFSWMEPVRKITFQDKEILLLDYSGHTGDGLIEIFDRAKKIALSDNKKVLLLNIFNPRHYITSKFIRHMEREMGEVEHLIAKNAVIGLSDMQQWILKGVNLWLKKKIHHFSSEEKALSFLVSSDTES